ncbi:hypothetical protein [Sphingomonas oryzagri]
MAEDRPGLAFSTRSGALLLHRVWTRSASIPRALWRLRQLSEVGHFWTRLASIGGDAVIGILAAAWLLLLVFIRPIDHDESQYVAATVLASHWLPYRDFDYFQTPLQPLLLAPLLNFVPAAPLVLLRCCNAVMGWLAAGLFGRLVGDITGSRAWGRGAILLLLATDGFQFAASTARNDMLPFLCVCCALLLLHRIEGWRGTKAVLAAIALGIVMAAGAGAKISYALPAVAIPVMEWTMPRSARRWPILGGYAVGAACVGIWLFAVIMQAPQRAWFDIITFPSRAPSEWYRAMGEGFDLSIAGRLLSFLKFASIGPALVLAAAILVGRDPAVDTSLSARLRGFCLGLAGAGAAAALLPAPVWRQYLLPLYAPLFLLGILHLRWLWGRRVWRAATAALALGGLILPSILAVGAVRDGSPLLTMERDAALLAASLRAQKVTDEVAGIAPEYIADADAPLDRRFAAGPFLFRTQHGLGHEAAIIGVDQGDVVAQLRRVPPAAILTGGDARTSGSASLDARWQQAARVSGYERVADLPDGLALWMRPRHVPR